MKQRFYLLALLFFFFVVGQAQNSQLARQYFQTGEYEKAGEIYKQLYTKSKNATYFSFYMKCLTALGEYDEAEKAIKKEIKRKASPDLYVIYGDLLELKSEMTEAEEMYQKAIQSISKNGNDVQRLTNAFRRSSKYDLALQVYERAQELKNDKSLYAYNMAGIYRLKGDVTKMAEYYIISLAQSPQQLASIQSVLSRELDREGMDILKEQTFVAIQNNPDAIVYPELLAWIYIQNKEYAKAMRQMRALDLRLNENGQRVFELAGVAANDRDYDTAISGYQYILDNKPNSTYTMLAKENVMKNKRRKITMNYNYTVEDLRSLEKEYEDFLAEKGRNTSTALIMGNLAELEALYLNDLDKAISILEELVQLGSVNKYVLNNAKLDLGDYYLMKGEIWEATLLYSQVDKEFKEGLLGEKARFRNAKLSYYNGDFEWAQSQFDILKASTSKLISNDAIDLSVFITDNLGLDSIATPMEWYSKADLLSFQNRYEEAFITLDSITLFYPEHGLTDDIYYTKAQIFTKQKNYDEAIRYYNLIIEDFADEIRADNAIYNLASLYENQLGESEKAKDLYEKLFLDYSNSTFAIDARKKYRILRGDEIN